MRLHVIQWDERSGEKAITLTTDPAGIELTINPKAPIEEIEAHIRKVLGESSDEDEWEIHNWTRGHSTLTIEWRNIHKELSVTTLIWSKS